MTFRAALRALTAVAVLLSATSLAGQEGDALFSDTIDVEVVNVEVIVTSADGMP